MTPYTKKIVELHKIHKAIEDCECKKDDEQGGGNLSSDVFFVPATIQPKYFDNDDGTGIIEIKDYTPANSTLFLYNKEDIISLGVNEEDLNNLNYVELSDAYDDVDNNNGVNGYSIPIAAFNGKIILNGIETGPHVITIFGGKSCYIYKIADDIFAIIEPVSGNMG